MSVTIPFRYNRYWRHSNGLAYSDLEIELTCFREDLQPEDGGLGRYVHYENILKMLWPDDHNHAWTERLRRNFCEEKHLIVAGCTAVGKSHEAAKFAIVWQQCDPLGSAIAVTSTSVNMARRRIWGVIARYWRESKVPLIGHLTDSTGDLQAIAGDKIHAISIIAGSQKFKQDGLGKLKGWHAPRVLILADELQDMTEEVVNGCANMMSGCVEAKFIGLGNAGSWLDTLGKLMVPIDGIESITVNDDEWLTPRGKVIHFDGLKSPNIIEGDKYKGIFGSEDLARIIKDYGENSLHYWQMARGFPCPEDASSVIVPQQLLIKFRALEPCTFVSRPITYAGLDPAFGGDGCTLAFAEYGYESGTSINVLSITDTVDIRTVISDEPADYQIARQVIARCKERGVSPECFSIDCTAIGRGVAAIIANEWSSSIHRVEFGGSASDMPISDSDSKTGKEEYCNRVTELWYSFRRFVQNSQIRNLPEEAAKQFSSRRYSTKGGKIIVEAKDLFKASYGRSPDDADAIVTIIDNIRRDGALKKRSAFDAGWSKFRNTHSEYVDAYSHVAE